MKIYIDFSMPRDLLESIRQCTSGHELVFPKKPVASVLHKAEWDPQIKTADIVFGQPDPEHITEAAGLKWIHISSSSITRYDNPVFRQQMAVNKIIVSNSADVYAEACADHALAFMLAQSRQLPAALVTRVAGGSETWLNLRSTSVPLRGQSVVILGYGAIGKHLTGLLQPFAMHITAYRRRARGDENVPVVTVTRLPDALAQADHVINILPDSAGTTRFFDAGRFSMIKTGAVFYNIGRGSTVDQEALLAALRSERIRAAWLDVTDPEPLPDSHPLWAQRNCFITPHVAGGHSNETGTLVRHFIENFDRKKGIPAGAFVAP